MAKEPIHAESCGRCMAPITQGQKQCDSCSKPTQYMTFAERTVYEVEQYRAWQERTASASA